MKYGTIFVGEQLLLPLSVRFLKDIRTKLSWNRLEHYQLQSHPTCRLAVERKCSGNGKGKSVRVNRRVCQRWQWRSYSSSSQGNTPICLLLQIYFQINAEGYCQRCHSVRFIHTQSEVRVLRTQFS